MHGIGKRALSSVAFLAVVACAACSSNPATPATSGSGDDAGDAGIVGCTTPGDTYVANLTRAGAQGKYTFTLVQAAPAPPSLDGNIWTLKIVDANGSAPDLAQVSVLPFMPQMGHGSDQTPQIAKNADGTFAVADVYLMMDGLWTVTFMVSLPPSVGSGDAGAEAGATTHTPAIIDQGVFTFCING